MVDGYRINRCCALAESKRKKKPKQKRLYALVIWHFYMLMLFCCCCRSTCRVECPQHLNDNLNSWITAHPKKNKQVDSATVVNGLNSSNILICMLEAMSSTFQKLSTTIVTCRLAHQSQFACDQNAKELWKIYVQQQPTRF